MVNKRCSFRIVLFHFEQNTDGATWVAWVYGQPTILDLGVQHFELFGGSQNNKII